MAMDDSMAFMGQMECGHLSIQQRLQNQASITIKKNRAILKSVLKQLYFVVNRIYSLRGSCEAISPVRSSQFAINPGSFQALLQFRIESGDEVLKDHFSAGRINAQYHSPKIQNDLIAAVGKMVSTKTNPRNQSRNIFHSCADEGTDVANKEHYL